MFPNITSKFILIILKVKLDSKNNSRVNGITAPQLTTIESALHGGESTHFDIRKQLT